jgi:hypothetical protein
MPRIPGGVLAPGKTAHLVPCVPATGLWCEVCRLQCRARVPFTVTISDGETYRTAISVCAGCDEEAGWPVSDPDPDGETPYEIPGTQPALEPSTEPERPLRAEDVAALLAKDVA